MSKFIRRLTYAILTIVALSAVLGSYLVWLFIRAEPDYRGQASIKGLTATVNIYRDAYGVPHIFAASMKDAAEALGYVHASERFFQMEMQRRAGQGRLSEIVGADMLGVDKFIRTLGLYHLAESSYTSMSPEAQAYFQAYADGVNAWLSSHPNTLPPELLLLKDKPELWRPADSVVWGKLMALQLSQNYERELLRGVLAQTITTPQLQQMFPAPSDNGPITTEPRELKKVETSPSLPTGLDQLGWLTSLTHAASNEWVIAGSRTNTGKPILANDPHLGLEAPILWYLARLVTPELTVKGATVPGLPIVLLGQNNDIAWGFTTTGSDVQDLFIETMDPHNPDHYLSPQGSVAFEHHTEVIHVKHGDDVYLNIRSTRHGPVLSDIDTTMAQVAGAGKVMALSFTGLGAHDLTSEALMHLDRAHDWQTFRDALKDYQAPPQNIVYADRKDNIGFINAGLVPIRKKGDGRFPSDGASGIYDWSGLIDFKEWPHVFNPSSGYLFNANNAVVDTKTAHFYGRDWEESYRAQRLQQFFDGISRHSLDSSALMQADHISLAARALMPYLQKAHSADPNVQQALSLLSAWDGSMDKARPEPLVFEAWLYQMHKQLLVDKTGNNLKAMGPYSATTMASILANNPSSWCDDKTCVTLISHALEDAIHMVAIRQGKDLTKWRWGQEHRALLQHKIFRHIPILSALSDLSVESSGDFYTLDRGGSFDDNAQYPFARTHGGGFRGLYDLNDPALSRFMITTGESGNIFSRHYGDLVPLWNDVKAIPLTGTQIELHAQGLPLLILQPARP